MSGHSKFSNIKHKKEAQDSLRSKMFLKISKQITVAVQKGGGDIATNPALRLSIAKAKAANMPKSNYQKIIAKAANPSSGAKFAEFAYEGYGQGGVAILVDCLTDNHNRTAANIKSLFNRAGASLGQNNSVARLFSRAGEIRFEKSNLSEDALFESLLDVDLSVLEYDPETGLGLIRVHPKSLYAVETILSETFGIDHFMVNEVKWVPKETISLNDSQLSKLAKLIQGLEADDDVDGVAHNCNNL